MMTKIMEPVFPSTIEGWEEALTTWENDVRRWETSAEETRSGSIKRAILNKNAPMGHPHAQLAPRRHLDELRFDKK